MAAPLRDVTLLDGYGYGYRHPDRETCQLKCYFRWHQEGEKIGLNKSFWQIKASMTSF